MGVLRFGSCALNFESEFKNIVWVQSTGFMKHELHFFYPKLVRMSYETKAQMNRRRAAKEADEARMEAQAQAKEQNDLPIETDPDQFNLFEPDGQFTPQLWETE